MTKVTDTSANVPYVYRVIICDSVLTVVISGKGLSIIAEVSKQLLQIPMEYSKYPCER
nr:MAG TPA: hypothetical protein [Caudoviricetes sp.]